MSEVNPYQSPVPEVEAVDDEKDVSWSDTGLALYQTCMTAASIAVGTLAIAIGEWWLVALGLGLVFFGCFATMCGFVLANWSTRRSRSRD